MQPVHGENQILLRGRVLSSPAFSHESHGEAYHTFPLSVPRLSGTADVLNILCAQSLLARWTPGEGDWAEVVGEVRSFNNRSGVGSRLVISVLCRGLSLCAPHPANALILAGALCKPPVFRRTPLGREICDLLLAVNRRYGRSDYLPCIAWGSLAQLCGALPVGQRLELEGRLQSRIYYKDENGVSAPHTAFEVSVMSLLRREQTG